jgi:hypothetical protein
MAAVSRNHVTSAGRKSCPAIGLPGVRGDHERFPHPQRSRGAGVEATDSAVRLRQMIPRQDDVVSGGSRAQAQGVFGRIRGAQDPPEIQCAMMNQRSSQSGGFFRDGFRADPRGTRWVWFGMRPFPRIGTGLAANATGWPIHAGTAARRTGFQPVQATRRKRRIRTAPGLDRLEACPTFRARDRRPSTRGRVAPARGSGRVRRRCRSRRPGARRPGSASRRSHATRTSATPGRRPWT